MENKYKPIRKRQFKALNSSDKRNTSFIVRVNKKDYDNFNFLANLKKISRNQLMNIFIKNYIVKNQKDFDDTRWNIPYIFESMDKSLLVVSSGSHNDIFFNGTVLQSYHKSYRIGQISSFRKDDFIKYEEIVTIRIKEIGA